MWCVFPLTLKPGPKLSKTSNFLSLDISLSMERIYIPYLYHQKSRNILNIIQRPTVLHLRSLMNFLLFRNWTALRPFGPYYSKEPSIVLQGQKLIITTQQGREVSDWLTVSGAELGYHTWIGLHRILLLSISLRTIWSLNAYILISFVILRSQTAILLTTTVKNTAFIWIWVT